MMEPERFGFEAGFLLEEGWLIGGSSFSSIVWRPPVAFCIECFAVAFWSLVRSKPKPYIAPVCWYFCRIFVNVVASSYRFYVY
jgi:hypothetical protein